MSRPVDEHTIVKLADGGAARRGKHAGDEGMNETGDAGEHHGASEPDGGLEMFDIAFSNRAGVLEKQALDHFFLHNSENNTPDLREEFTFIRHFLVYPAVKFLRYQVI